MGTGFVSRTHDRDRMDPVLDSPPTPFQRGGVTTDSMVRPPENRGYRMNAISREFGAGSGRPGPDTSAWRGRIGRHAPDDREVFGNPTVPQGHGRHPTRPVPAAPARAYDQLEPFRARTAVEGRVSVCGSRLSGHLGPSLPRFERFPPFSRLHGDVGLRKCLICGDIRFPASDVAP